MSEGQTVRQRLELDTSGYDAKLKASGDISEAVARKQEQASLRAQRAWEKELVAQDRRLQKEQAVARQKELSALKADILARSETSAADAAARQEAALAKLTAALSGEAGAADQATSANTRLAGAHRSAAGGAGELTNATRAVSGGFQELEGRIPIRALERFLSTSLGLSSVLAGAFEVVGAVALLGIVVELSRKAYEAEQNFVHLKSAIQGLGELQINVDKTVGQTNDAIEGKVENILEHTAGKPAALQQKYRYDAAKPVDLESYFYSDQYKKLPDDVKVNYESRFKTIQPQDVSKRLAELREESQKLHEAAADAANPANFGMVAPKVAGFGPQKGRDYADYYKTRATVVDQLIPQVQGKSDLRSANLQSIQIDAGDAQQQEKDKAARKAEEAQRKAEEAARKAQERYRQNVEKQHSAQEAQLTDLKSHQDVSAVDEYTFWQKMAAAPNVYPENLQRIKARSAELYQEMGRQINELLKGYDEANKRAAAQQAEAMRTGERMMDEWGAVDAKRAEAAAKLRDVGEQNQAAMQELVRGHELATGAISKYDSAQMAATDHAKKYAAQLAQIETDRQAELGKIDKSSPMADDQAKTINATYDAKQQTVQGEADRTALADKWEADQQTAVGGFLSALKEISAAGRDFASQTKSLTTSMANDINETLLNMLTSNKSARQLLKGLGADLAKKAAGAALGIGESSLLHLIPGFATGVDNFGGGPAWVGENGPELLNLPRGASVTPNGKSMAALGGNQYHFKVDARGSTDPAGTMAMVQMGIKQSLPHIVSTTIKAHKDMDSRRNPAGR